MCNIFFYFLTNPYMTPIDIDCISGSELRNLVRSRGIRNRDLEEALVMPQTVISRYLNDHVAMPASFIVKVAAICGFTISDLITGPDADKVPVFIPPTDTPDTAAEPVPVYGENLIPVSQALDIPSLLSIIQQMQDTIRRMDKQLKHITPA